MFLLSICRESLSDLRQRVVVDGPRSEWIPIASGMPQGSTWSRLFILYTCNMYDLVDNRLSAYVVDSTRLAIVRKPYDRPTVAA